MTSIRIKKINEKLLPNNLISKDKQIKAKHYNLNNLVSEDVQIELKNVQIKPKDPIVLISHDARQEGAPLIALSIAKYLKEQYKKNVYTVLIQGGPLEKEFKKYGTVYNLNERNLYSLENEEKVIQLFQKLKNLGAKECICNTVVTGNLLPILKKLKFKCVSLVHELPTSIKICGLTQASKNTALLSDKVIFPSNYVMDTFLNEFSFNESKAIVKPQGVRKNKYFLRKIQCKTNICKKISIEKNSKIILGCGNADLRKGFDIFCQVAKSVIRQYKDDYVHFLWLGNRPDKMLEQFMKHDLKKLGIFEQIHFIDYLEDPLEIFAAADVFLLTSREDPFPSVVLEAMDSGTPVIAFKDGGGSPEILINGCGIVVPYLDVSAMADKTIELLYDKEKYNNITRKAKEKIVKEFDYIKYVGFIIRLFEKKNLKNSKTKSDLVENSFKVSVIIPNYNYEKFLEERINSILYQTYKPFEIIFLDDASKDNSILAASKLLDNSDIPYQIIENTENVGCFKQWSKGIQKAKGDLIWIAEADDFCELNFLEKMVKRFADGEVNLVYSQSQVVNEYSQKINYSYIDYTRYISFDKWLRDYCRYGIDEVNDSLSIQNTIPNASAVVIRKSALEGLEKYLIKYKTCGDWLTYIYVLRKGKLYFCSDILNYHRKHPKSIISVYKHNFVHLSEMIDIKNFVIDNFDISKDNINKFLDFLGIQFSLLNFKTSLINEIQDHPEFRLKYSMLVNKVNKLISKSNDIN